MDIAEVVGQHQRIMVDTAPFIYLIEEHKEFGGISERLFSLIEKTTALTCIASVITLTEVLSKPMQAGRDDLVEAYRSVLVDSGALMLCPVDDDIAEKAASLRAQFGIKTPDAIQLATAIENNASLFVTNDRGIPELDGLKLVVLADFVE